MHRRRRRPWILTALTLLLALGCGPWEAWYSSREFFLGVDRGTVYYFRGYFVEQAWHFAPTRVEPPESWASLWPDFTSRLHRFPLWIPLALFVIWTAFAWRSYVRNQPRFGTCSSCGYDLSGNLSGVCPECGVAVGAAAK